MSIMYITKYSKISIRSHIVSVLATLWLHSTLRNTISLLQSLRKTIYVVFNIVPLRIRKRVDLVYRYIYGYASECFTHDGHKGKRSALRRIVNSKAFCQKWCAHLLQEYFMDPQNQLYSTSFCLKPTECSWSYSRPVYTLLEVDQNPYNDTEWNGMENEATNVYEPLWHIYPESGEGREEGNNKHSILQHFEIVAAIFPQSGVGILKHLTPLWSPFYKAHS